MKTAIVDVDDLYTEQQIIDYLLPLKEAVPSLVVTAYAIPNKLGSVDVLKNKYPWIVFAAHGFEHTHFECLSWVEPLAEARLQQALAMGYAPLFKAPNWDLDAETERALRSLGIVLHHHPSKPPTTEGLKVFPGKARGSAWKSIHTHIQKNPATDWIGDHPDFKPEVLQTFENFATPLDFVEEWKP